MKKICVLISLVLLFISINTHAATSKMIFWYPGEAGSTEEAQPVLDDFFAYLKAKDPSLVIEGAYFNTVDEGKSYIRSKRPALGIVSYPVWVMQRSAFPQAKVILVTLPKPHGQSTEQYVLMGTEPLSDNGQPLYTSEPLNREFIASKLIPNLPASLKPTQTNSILKKLKDMSTGTVKGYALLTPIEAHTLRKMKVPWKAKLSTLTTSFPVPTARFLLLNGGFTKTEVLTAILVKMNSDPQGKAILEELRLVGFSAN